MNTPISHPYIMSKKKRVAIYFNCQTQIYNPTRNAFASLNICVKIFFQFEVIPYAYSLIRLLYATVHKPKVKVAEAISSSVYSWRFSCKRGSPRTLITMTASPDSNATCGAFSGTSTVIE